MENKYFDLIVKRVGNVLINNGFKKQEITNDNEDLLNAVFSGENGSIRLTLDYNKKRVELYVSRDIDVSQNTLWNLDSSWLFDPYKDGEKEAISIANDFSNLLKEGAEKKSNKRKRKKDGDEANVDPQFFLNRLLNVFPILKYESDYEKNNYASFRHVTFIKERVLPQIKVLLESNDTVKIKRFCKFLSDSYENGDKDVRSIITIVILNSIEDPDTKEKVNDSLSKDLQKVWTAARKIKNKKIRPEKIKSKKSFMSRVVDQSYQEKAQ